MKRSVPPQQQELFAQPSSESLVTLPMVNCVEVAQLLSKLLGEVVHARAESTQRTRRSVMTKISREHLSRGAYVYVRQSTADQLQHNHESRRRQYALADRARSLGFAEVVVIDDDLGIPGLA